MATINYDERGMDLAPAAGYTYHVEWEQCQTPVQILEWVLHLSEKRWCTAEVLRDFVGIATDHHHIDVHQMS